jgi:hypothetical protein
MPLTEADLCYWNPNPKASGSDCTDCHWHLGVDSIDTKCTHYMPRFTGYLSGCPKAKELDAVNARHGRV